MNQAKFRLNNNFDNNLNEDNINCVSNDAKSFVPVVQDSMPQQRFVDERKFVFLKEDVTKYEPRDFLF